MEDYIFDSDPLYSNWKSAKDRPLDSLISCINPSRLNQFQVIYPLETIKTVLYPLMTSLVLPLLCHPSRNNEILAKNPPDVISALP